jgi:predicted amidohydrolase YtcJ
VHPGGAAMHEFDHDIPDMQTIDDVLAYIGSQTKKRTEDQWIWVSQIFITRLREQRFPTRDELDRVAPHHAVVFQTGPDAALNSKALKLSGIDEDFRVVGSGHLERDPKTGKLNGILRACTRLIKSGDTGDRKATEEDRQNRLVELIHDYNSVGITALADRAAGSDDLNRYDELLKQDRLTARISASWHVDTEGSIADIQKKIREIGEHPLHRRHEMLQLIGIKTFLDGGMLTGSAYMREPWGVSKIYSIDDPRYRGVRFIEDDKLVPIVQAAVESDLQFTAHSVGDGAVHALLAAYAKVNETTPIAKTRPCLTHSNFMSAEAIDQMVKLDVVADIQPAWLYLDTRTLHAQFGYDRLRYFQPLSTIFKRGAIAGGGSDHMQKIGSLRSINPYNPFLGMATAITRKARWHEGQLHPEECLTREQALKFYTWNNAYLLFQEENFGSLEVGKLADMVILDRDILACPIDELQSAQVIATYLGGKLVYERK